KNAQGYWKAGETGAARFELRLLLNGVRERARPRRPGLPPRHSASRAAGARLVLGGLCIDHLLLVTQLRLGGKVRVRDRGWALGAGGANNAIGHRLLAPNDPVVLL